MKYVKERNFVKDIFESNKQEVKKSTIKILESLENNGELISVTFKDRFGRTFEASKQKGKKLIRELT